MPTHYFIRMANYWLLKSEPNVYSITDLQRDGSTCWEGVRNYSARNNMRRMTVGDLALFYHSNANPKMTPWRSAGLRPSTLIPAAAPTPRSTKIP